jgi:hypothetical protein
MTGKLFSNKCSGSQQQYSFPYEYGKITAGKVVNNTTADNGWHAEKNQNTQFPGNSHTVEPPFSISSQTGADNVQIYSLKM